MRIKVFQAATMKDAMAQVKDELGDDAVILHTKKIKKGGILGYGAKEIFEVTAALDEVTRRPPKKRSERLPTLAELQAEAAGGETKPKSAVPLPQGHAAALTQAAPVAPAQQAPVPVPAGSPVAPVPPLMQSAQPMQQPPPIELQQPRLSQSAAKSYRTAGTEAAVAEAARQARAASPVAHGDASAEPFVPSFPSGKAPEAPFQPLVPSAGEAPQEPPVRKARRRKPAQPKRRKVHAAEAKETAGVEVEREASSSRRGKREEDEAAASSQEKRREDESPSSKSEEERQRETIEELQNELAQMKAMLVQVVSKEKTPEDEMSLQQVLKQQEVESDIIDDVVLQLPAEAILADKDTPLALEGLKKYLADNGGRP